MCRDKADSRLTLCHYGITHAYSHAYVAVNWDKLAVSWVKYNYVVRNEESLIFMVCVYVSPELSLKWRHVMSHSCVYLRYDVLLGSGCYLKMSELHIIKISSLILYLKYF